jgi:hypothetical protein
MPPELIAVQPTPALQKRVTRIMADALVLGNLSAAEARGVYEELQKARDALSRILDRADGKNA